MTMTITGTCPLPDHEGSPSRSALAARSLNAALRLTGPARGEALRRHFEEFCPPPKRFCRTHRPIEITTLG